jgi:hypothetical protein
MLLVLPRGFEQNFLLEHSAEELSSNGCLFESHYVEAKRHCTENGYVPKWNKRVGRVEKLLACSHPHCSITSVEARLIAPH